MKIKPKQVDDKPKNQGDIIELLFFIALNVLVVPFSTYQTFVGYEKDVAGNAILALIVAAISGVFFLAMNFGIRKSRLNGEKHFLKVLMYIVPLAISVPGNFNAFYSNQMKEGLLRTEVSEYKFVLNQTKDKSVQLIQNKIKLQNLESGFNQRITLLHSEVTGIGRTGWGSKADKAWRDLVGFLNAEGGQLNYSDIGTNSNFYYSNAKKFAQSSNDQLVLDRKNSIQPKLDYISGVYNPVIARIDSLTNLAKPIFNSKMLDDMVSAENTIRSETESFLNRTDLFTYEKLKPSNENEIGTIKHSFNSAFIKWESTTAAVFSLFLSLIIDFAALLYILVFIPYNKQSRGGNGGRLINNGPKRI